MRQECDYLDDSGYKVIATANANQTYGQQLSTLYSSFQTLSNDERLNSLLLDGSQVFHPSTTSGAYQRVTSTTSGTVVIRVATLYDSKYFSGNPPTLSDVSNNTNSNTISLLVLK